MALWAEMLRDLDAQAATLAVKRLIASSKWPPSVAEVREAAVENVRPMRVTAKPGNAWAHVQHAREWFGADADRAREYLGGTMWAVIQRAGGWEGLTEKRFLAAYSAFGAVVENTRQIPESVDKGVERMVSGLAARLAQGMLMGDSTKKLEGQ